MKELHPLAVATLTLAAGSAFAVTSGRLVQIRRGFVEHPQSLRCRLQALG